MIRLRSSGGILRIRTVGGEVAQFFDHVQPIGRRTHDGFDLHRSLDDACLVDPPRDLSEILLILVFRCLRNSSHAKDRFAEMPSLEFGRPMTDILGCVVEMA
ncbi:hypothetical protein ASF53_13580 [Methylobacterium sp. Leaf123]|nr:hypothetical protein ASF53_13580 [Methylobacterium sp. Leaf123]